MTLWSIWLTGLGTGVALMVLTWIASVVQKDASLVDRVWGLAFVVLAWTYAVAADVWSTRTWLALALVTVWGVRLSVFITWRNWGHGEDARYRAMRAKRPETFTNRSLVSVFLLQAVLAWLISVPLLGATALDGGTLGLLDAVAVAVWSVGFAFEAGGDAQLARFLADPANRGKVMDQGFWRFTRHPNYFGDTVVWWSFLLLALAVGAWWGVFGTVLMSVLIVKVSGVALTERRMGRPGKAREGYDEYVRRTNAFFPGPRRS
jgi:steroid 5-alpha reductase family enzyme